MSGSSPARTNPTGPRAAWLCSQRTGESVYDGKLTQIKGRGNSTWKGAKRPYQIKLDKKTDLLQTGDSADKAKTWVLLANFYDPSAVRNMLALDLGRALQMECNMGYRRCACSMTASSAACTS